MSTYLPGITGYIPQIQPFTPDYNFLTSSLQARQNKYDAAYNQISNVYGALLNSPLTKDENIKAREEFFKAVDNDIKRLSGLDLSLQQNVDHAMDIFAPFYENKDIVNDMVWTKNALSQKQRGELMRYCLDPKKCGGQWWEGGDKYINYKIQEFKNTTREQALNFKPVNYIAKQDVIGMAMADAKANGFELKYDQVQGGYIVTTKNGDKLTPALTEYFKAKFGNDPKVMEYYKANAYNTRNDFVYAKAQELGSLEEANKLYLETAYSEAMTRLNKSKSKNDENKEIVSSKLEASKKTLETYKPLPSDKAIVEKVQALEQDSQIIDANGQQLENVENIVKKLGMNVNNMSAYNDYVDDLVAYVTLENESSLAASAYAELNQSTSFKADPYKEAVFKHNLDMQKMMASKQLDFDFWVKKETWKLEHENKINDYVRERLSSQTFVTEPGGVATNILDQNYSFNNNQNKGLQILASTVRAKEDYVKTTISSLNSAVESDQVTAQVAAATYKQVFQGTGIDANKILAGDEGELSKLSRHPNLGDIYGRLTRAINPDDPSGGFGMKNWSETYWNSTSMQRYNINKDTQLYRDFTSFSENQSKTATSYAEAQFKSDKDQASLNMLNLAKQNMSSDGRGRLASTFFLSPEQKTKTINQYAYNNGVSVKEAAKVLDKVEKEWRANYAIHSKSWDQINPTGPGGSNARTAGAMQSNFDAAYSKSDPRLSGNRNLIELLQNYRENPSQAIVRYGGLEQDYRSGNDPQASQLLERITSDFLSSDYKSTNVKRPKGHYTFSRIASHDPNYFGFQVKIDPAYAESLKGKAKDQGLTFDNKWVDGISVFIPKSAANNSLYQQTQYSDINFILDTKGIYTVNDFPNAGKIEIKKSGEETYDVNGYIISVNPQTGEDIKIPASDYLRQSFGTNKITGLNVNGFLETLLPAMASLQYYNRNAKDALRTRQ